MSGSAGWKFVLLMSLTFFFFFFFYVSGSSVITSMQAVGPVYDAGMLWVRGRKEKEGGYINGKRGGQGHIWHISGAIPVWFKVLSRDVAEQS